MLSTTRDSINLIHFIWMTPKPTEVFFKQNVSYTLYKKPSFDLY